MPYTLAKWALWLIAAALVGGLVGWLLRGLGRPAAAPVDEPDHEPDEPSFMPSRAAEVELLRAKVADLQGAAAERDRLHRELVTLRDAASSASRVVAAETDTVLALTKERDEWAARAASSEQVAQELRVRLWNAEARLVECAPTQPDLAAGQLVLGPQLRLDDLTVVEGIGPKIAELCRARGITTWRLLADTDPVVLRDLLSTAGPKFSVHDPGSWPEQARLLAEGQWVAFRTLTERIRSGRDAG